MWQGTRPCQTTRPCQATRQVTNNRDENDLILQWQLQPRPGQNLVYCDWNNFSPISPRYLNELNLEFKKDDLRENLRLKDRPFLPAPFVQVPVDCESKLLTLDQGLLKNPVRDISQLEHQLNYLPPFGNPQRVNHVIEPPLEMGGWIRGGKPTR